MLLFANLLANNSTDNLLSVAATEPSLLLAALAGNNKDGEGESILFIG